MCQISWSEFVRGDSEMSARGNCTITGRKSAWRHRASGRRAKNPRALRRPNTANRPAAPGRVFQGNTEKRLLLQRPVSNYDWHRPFQTSFRRLRTLSSLSKKTALNDAKLRQEDYGQEDCDRRTPRECSCPRIFLSLFCVRPLRLCVITFYFAS